MIEHKGPCWKCGRDAGSSTVLRDHSCISGWSAWLYEDLFLRICCVYCGAWMRSERFDRRFRERELELHDNEDDEGAADTSAPSEVTRIGGAHQDAPGGG